MLKKIIRHFYSKERYIDALRKDGVKIGKGCDIFKNVMFGSEPYLISIGNDCRISHNVKFITHDGGMWVLRNMGLSSKNADKIGPISIGNNVNIGWDVIILPNVSIGDNVIIGAGAIVTKDVPSNSIVAGVPAKVIETIDEYYLKNKDSFIETKGLSKKDKKSYLLSLYKKDK